MSYSNFDSETTSQDPVKFINKGKTIGQKKMIAAAIFISMKYYFPISLFQTIRYFGLTLILTSIILRSVVINSLGKYFTVDVTIRQGHQLKKDGFYKYLRHPSYSASLLSFIGFGISLNNWISLIIVVAAILFAFIRRINVEEKALMEHFGKEYTDYKKETYRLIPFIYWDVIIRISKIVLNETLVGTAYHGTSPLDMSSWACRRRVGGKANT